MGQTLSEPVISKESASCGNTTYKVGSSSMQGWRVSMEDAHVHFLSLPGDEEASFFGVYDGHGGSAISRYAGNHLHKFVIDRPSYRGGDIPAAIREGFLAFDLYLQTDEKMKREIAGTTAVTVLIKGNQLYCGNAGDSRAVACVKGSCRPLSFDHKPSNPTEQARITGAGGWVEYNRVNGNLALSRALGDFAFKRNPSKSPEEQMVTALPDVERKTITEDWEFIIMACDGIWDVVSNDEACDFVRCLLGNGMEPDKICEELMTACLAPDCQMGGLGCDNMTVIVICFLHGKSWKQYCSKIAETLEPSLLGYTRRLQAFPLVDSSDDDDDVIPVDRLVAAETIAASLSISLSQTKQDIIEPVPSEGVVDSQVFQDVIEAGDYVHKGTQVLKGATQEPATVPAKNPPITMLDIVGGLDEDVNPRARQESSTSSTALPPPADTTNQQQQQTPPPQSSQVKKSSSSTSSGRPGTRRNP